MQSSETASVYNYCDLLPRVDRSSVMTQCCFRKAAQADSCSGPAGLATQRWYSVDLDERRECTETRGFDNFLEGAESKYERRKGKGRRPPSPSSGTLKLVAAGSLVFVRRPIPVLDMTALPVCVETCLCTSVALLLLPKLKPTKNNSEEVKQSCRETRFHIFACCYDCLCALHYPVPCASTPDRERVPDTELLPLYI